ncbi:DUF4291 domain-containing protein [Paracraurococcus ruber]|uniref:DUF4291 domain-containing protein n=1 Tax=Paracraurococcus ruber TaxID=77675 RepID=A0ABS1D6G0_9PROT|nr:DUF4291 domain-containing protein [Paracraurococcus ruber]MBK1662384.1 hypothetical protein [Paracraurococcus ruber]TDG11447.1 DUF4291 domain-containing protein [Paracraurococcus ruber]
MLEIELYSVQVARWPARGRHLLAHHDAQSIVVYQAYRPEAAAAAVRDGRLGGWGFSLKRMSWIKPNFLWMMHRSGWATKKGQERILALRLARADFERLIAQGVYSSFQASGYEHENVWKRAVRAADVQFQWDPDHDPSGAPLARRALQIGLRGDILEEFAHRMLLGVEDITDFVVSQRIHDAPWNGLMTPCETLYPRTAKLTAILRLEDPDI